VSRRSILAKAGEPQHGKVSAGCIYCRTIIIAPLPAWFLFSAIFCYTLSQPGGNLSTSCGLPSTLKFTLYLQMPYQPVTATSVNSFAEDAFVWLDSFPSERPQAGRSSTEQFREFWPEAYTGLYTGISRPEGKKNVLFATMQSVVRHLDELQITTIQRIFNQKLSEYFMRLENN